MKKRTVAAWTGVTMVLATGMSLLRQSQAVVAAKPGMERQQIAAGEAERLPDVEHARADVDKQIQRTALRAMSSTTLPSPPLPSRVLPGPLPTSEQAAPEREGALLPMPPVPSKTPPGAIPEGAQNNSRVLNEAEPIDPS
jgi:hypothetical protein